MQPVYITDPSWQSTFPHLVEPLDDEWLAGLLLRCDEVNGWESGTTLAHLRSMSGSRQPVLIPHLIIPTELRLEYLAEWLALPVSSLRGTTYLSELTRCYSVLHPLPGDLRPTSSFRICPVCLAENRLLKRTLTLLHVSYCPWHEVMLLMTCQCGAPLRPFDLQTPPFTCYVCGRDWADLPRLSPTPERIAVTRQLLSCYEMFLNQGDPILVKYAFEAVAHTWEREIRHGWIPPAVNRPFRRSSSQSLASNGVHTLGPLVFNLVRYHLFYDPKVIFWGQEYWS